jgi:malate synthase
VADLAPRNIALLAERDRLQTELDTWHKATPARSPTWRPTASFLKPSATWCPSPPTCKATTVQCGRRAGHQAGPQLVVPILNARYALNAANARWGSLYDALYGTDAIPETDGAEKGKGYNPVRGAKVIEFARNVLDQTRRWPTGSHKDATGYRVEGGQLVVALKNGSTTGLKNPAQFTGYQGNAAAPSSVLLQHNGLHLDIQIDRSTPSARPMPPA